MKTSIVLLAFAILLSGCVSQPSDPSFRGAGDINEAQAAKTRVSLGLTYLKNGNFTQAKFNLDKALEFAPRSADAHFAMAYYYEQVEEQSRAQEYYENALKYDSKNPDIINSYGAFLCRNGEYDKAKGYFLQAVNSKSYVSTAETYENLAICSQEQGKLSEAQEYYISALNHQPTRAKTLFSLARLQAQEGDYQQAKKNLWKYERVAPSSIESLFLNYQIARGLDDTKTALEFGEQLKQRFPEHALTAQFVKEMGKFQPVAKITSKPVFDSSVIKSEATSKSQSIEASEAAIKTALKTRKQLSPNELNDSPSVQSTSENYHIVKPKENLYRISLQYNVKMKQLMAWNNIDDPSAINIGMKLWVKDPNNND